eukprot:g66886.t1
MFSTFLMQTKVLTKTLFTPYFGILNEKTKWLGLRIFEPMLHVSNLSHSHFLYYRHRADTVRREGVACTDGSREKLALMTSPAALKLANETACMYCKLDLRHTAVFAQLTPMDGRNVSTYLNLAPRYVLTGSFICGNFMVSRNTFGIWLSFSPAYTAHTPKLQNWSIMRVYYPSEELRADGKYTMLPGKGEQRFLPKHLNLYYNVLGYSAQAMCKARNPEESGLLPAFLHLWHTARLHIQSLCKDEDLPCSEHDAKLVEPLTRYTEALAESLVKESAYKQQSAALTGQQNRQLAPLFLTRASSLLTQTLFPCPDGAAQEAAGLLETVPGLAQGAQNLASQELGLAGADRAKRNETTYLAPISVDVVRSHVLREFLTRAVRHFQDGVLEVTTPAIASRKEAYFRPETILASPTAWVTIAAILKCTQVTSNQLFIDDHTPTDSDDEAVTMVTSLVTFTRPQRLEVSVSTHRMEAPTLRTWIQDRLDRRSTRLAIHYLSAGVPMSSSPPSPSEQDAGN